MHSQRTIHRDIKPPNILLTREGVVKLADFGVSGELINSIAGTFTGTSLYMAVSPRSLECSPWMAPDDTPADRPFTSASRIRVCTPHLHLCLCRAAPQPERLSGHDYKIQSDVWSTGITLLELVTNRFPFPTDLAAIELMMYIVQNEVRLPAP